MERAKPIFLWSIIFLLGAFGYVPASCQTIESPNAKHLVLQMIEKTRQIRSLSFNIKKKERVRGKLQEQETFVKVNMQPFKTYLKQLAPKQGLEVLYVKGENNQQAYINTNGFPWITLHLDPMGSIMRKDQHHTLFESGFEYFMSILEHLTTKYHHQLEFLIQLSGSTVLDGSPCWIVTFNNPHYKHILHKAKKGESVLSIANSLKVSEYAILELNPSLSDYYSLKEGQTIKIPNDYAPKLELYIDKKHMVPLLTKVYDEQGLYEYYEYTQVKINPTFSQTEFSKENSEYGF
jgi:hypothetical protein